MKLFKWTLFCIVAFILLGFSIGQAAEVTLTWNIVEPDCATYLYGSKIPGSYVFQYPVAREEMGIDQTTISNMKPGITYYFVLTHFDDVTGMESEPSTEVSYTPPTPPNNKVITPIDDDGEVPQSPDTVTIQ